MIDLMESGDSPLSKNKIDFILRRIGRLLTMSQPCRNIIEIGCYKGSMLSIIKNTFGDEVEVIGYDTFTGLPSLHDFDGDTDAPHAKGDFGDTDFSQVESAARASGAQVFKARFPRGVQDFPVMFAHLDVDLYVDTVLSLDWLSENLAPTGEIIVDDYGWHRTPGVEIAVKEILNIGILEQVEVSDEYQIVLRHK